MIRNLFGGSKCRTIDVCDIFGDNSGKALYRLDGNANDESGNYHGTETAMTYGGGTYGRGGVFNGSSSSVQSGWTGTDDYSISVWIKTNQLSPSPFSAITNSLTVTNPYSYTIYQNPNGVIAMQDSHGGTNLYTPSNTIDSTSKWYHIVTTKVGVARKIYIDGALSASDNNGLATIAKPTGILIGKYYAQATAPYSFNGSIDQVRIFNRAITQTEVSTLFAECAPTSIVDDINPFLDGSLLNKCTLEGNVTSLIGTSPTITGTVTYGTGKFGQGISGFSIDGSLTFNATGIKTISMFIAPMSPSGAGDRWIIDNRAVGGTEYFRLNSLGQYDFAGGLTVKKNGIPLTSGTAHPTAGIFEHISIELTTARNAVHIGNVNTNNDGHTTNKIDQIELYNRVLTPMEVAALCTETTPMEEPMSHQVDPFKDGSGKALYRLEGNALDESGNYNGTPTSVTYGNAPIGREAIFGGASSITATLALSANTFSYSVWATVTTVSSTIQSLIDFSTGRAMLSSGNGTNAYISYYDGTAYRVFGTYALTSATRTHIGLAVNGTSVELFINGVSQGTSACSAVTPSGTMALGKYAGSASGYLTGRENQTRIFSRVLTVSEFLQLYNQGA